MRIIRLKSSRILARAMTLLWLKRIYLGPAFDKLDEDVKGFVLAHEAGHIFHRHTEKRIFALLFRPNTLPELWKQQEYEADLYAAKQGHVEAAHKFLMNCKGGPKHPSGLQRRHNLIKNGFSPNGTRKGHLSQGTA